MVSLMAKMIKAWMISFVMNLMFMMYDLAQQGRIESAVKSGNCILLSFEKKMVWQLMVVMHHQKIKANKAGIKQETMENLLL